MWRLRLIKLSMLSLGEVLTKRYRLEHIAERYLRKVRKRNENSSTLQLISCFSGKKIIASKRIFRKLRDGNCRESLVKSDKKGLFSPLFF